MGDLFHPCTRPWQIKTVLEVVQNTPQHIHIFCTKNPIRYADFNPWPENCWLLTTITGLGKEDGRVGDLLKADAKVLGLSLEPLLGPVDLTEWISCYRPDVAKKRGEYRYIQSAPKDPTIQWLIIGAYTGRGAIRFRPARTWVQSLIDQARTAGTPIFLKNNLHWPERIQEFPMKEFKCDQA